VVDQPHWIDVTLNEYRTLREESLQALRQQQTVLQLGLAAVGVLTGIGVQAREDEALAGLLLMGFIPSWPRW
jgi:hypothetical protein